MIYIKCICVVGVGSENDKDLTIKSNNILKEIYCDSKVYEKLKKFFTGKLVYNTYKNTGGGNFLVFIGNKKNSFY